MFTIHSSTMITNFDPTQMKMTWLLIINPRKGDFLIFSIVIFKIFKIFKNYYN